MTDFYDRLNLKQQYNKDDFLIYNLKEMNRQNIEEAKNGKDLPNFNYKRDDANLNLTPKIMPSFEYENKKMFNSYPMMQTEQDEQGMAIPFLDNYYGYKDYGNFLSTNQDLPKDNNIRRTPKNNLYQIKK